MTAQARRAPRPVKRESGPPDDRGVKIHLGHFAGRFIKPFYHDDTEAQRRESVWKSGAPDRLVTVW
jgi:hypothetical protein